MHFLKASPFGLVSMYHKNRDRHCAYRPVASIGGRTLDLAAIIQLNERDLNNKSDVFESASDSRVNESEEDNNKANHSMLETETSTSKTSKERKYVLNNKGKATGQREVRPVWNNAKMVNHQNFSNNVTHPHPIRNFIPTAVITNSDKVPVNTFKQSSPRAPTSTITARYVNTTANRPTVNGTKLSANVFHKSHSPVRMTFNQRTTPKNSDLKEIVNTVKDQGIFDSGCSRHMMGNKYFLTDYQEIDGGFVAFGGSLKGDHLGKFKWKADEGFLVGYSINRKGPEWLFDIDSLTNFMNYELVTARNQTNNDACIEINTNAGKAGQKKAFDHEYILLPIMPSSTQSSDDKDAGEVDEGVSKGSGIDDQCGE
nr:hypothetical protein [Tanacetum cinerariifolium]